jgi:ribonuclease P protein component
MTEATPTKAEGAQETRPLPFSRLPVTSLRGDRAFRRVRAKGKPGRSSLLSFRWLPLKARRGETLSVQVGIVVSKKVGKAVVRNLVRRRLREAVRRMDWPALEAMIVVQPEAATANYAELFKALKAAASKSGLR